MTPPHQATATKCLGCDTVSVRELLNFGAQPASNRFVGGGVDDADRHPLVLGQCGACALVQLVDAMPVAMVKSRFEWVAYNEPEGHLDALVARLAALPGITQQSRVLGLTYKDDSTLARLAKLGFHDTSRFAAKRDFGIDDPFAGLETIQGIVDEASAARLAATYGPADILIARHVIEHGHDPSRFLRGLIGLLAEGGYLVLEMPDCTKFMRGKDYSFVWEEHICYFCPDSLRAFTARHGLGDMTILSYPYPLEDSLVAVLRRGQQGAVTFDATEALRMGKSYADGFSGTRDALRGQLRALRSRGTRIAVFGAGHLAAKFINLFELADLLECVVDDNPHKQGLLMPGSHLPILGSATLIERSIGLCLLSLSPESEQKVLARQQAFIDNGGKFASIFALSPLAMGAR